MEKRNATLEAPPGFSLKPTVLSHGWHECAPMSWSEGGRCFQWITREDADVYRVSVVESTRKKRAIFLSVSVDARISPSDEVLERILADLRIILRLNHDLSEFHELCRADPFLHVIPKIGAGRGLRSPRMAENIVKALCATNVTWSQAVKMINRIAQLGPTLPHFVNLHAWPTPKEILRAGERYLTEVCRVGYRAESILAFCRDVCAGQVDPELFDEMASSSETNSADILEQLRSIRGIGPSSAHYLLSFLGRHDHLSIDSATIAHVARTHTRGRKPTPKQIEKIYAHYGKWKNLCWWYEHWLTWETGQQIVREAGLDGSPRRGSSPGKRRAG